MRKATWQALRFDTVMQGKDVKRILIKIVRKLLSRIHEVVRTEIPYQKGLIS
ncbi:hypothetical protein ACJRPK_07640 [Aquimarina sp. 2-A2]|uniref:hypothetical protein n=1 Tax=Aquimarina sp. 2-A2 TaxID=3382644 RepID=UPI00387F0D57